jgi:membrane-anchored mycosin MYCP
MTVAARRHIGVLVAVGLVMAAVLALVSRAAAVTGTDYVLYYTVTSSYQGAPENLKEIAARFLGDSARATDIFNLNAGRPQADGDSLQDPNKLHAGWRLILPWDAVGAAVQNGLLPTTIPAPPATPRAGGAGATKQSGQPGRSGRPPASGAASARPGPVTSGAAGGGSGCASAPGHPGGTNWATVRLAPSQAWRHTRGTGELVAVIDSGVDGGVSQLAGHVAVGADVVAGSGRGDTDCVGSGTAMAGLIVAQPDRSGSVYGVAPDATVLPIRVIGPGATHALPADEATAIEVAVSAGATVIALGGYVDPTEDEVAQAITRAVQHDVVVVAGTPATSARPVADGNEAGVLYVAAVDANGELAGDYQPGAVNLVAPGLNVTSLGLTGAGLVSRSGTQYAVALVAGAAALVRAAYPKLSAAQVARRVEATADPVTGTGKDGEYGSGMIDLAAAVTRSVAEPTPDPPPGVGSRVDSSAAGWDLLMVAGGLVALLGLVLLVVRGRRALRGDPAGPGGEDEPMPTGPGAAPVRGDGFGS